MAYRAHLAKQAEANVAAEREELKRAAEPEGIQRFNAKQEQQFHHAKTVDARRIEEDRSTVREEKSGGGGCEFVVQ